MLKEKINLFCNQNKKILISIVALLEAILVLSVATFSWIEGTKDGNVKESENSTVTAGAGLMFEDINGNAISQITLPNINLEDCSSVDGRNFFFPITESTGSDIKNYKFRAGTEADKNTKYISTDFTVESLATSKIFIGLSSKVKCKDKKQGILNALRISLNFNDGSNPIVFCPGLISGEYHELNNAVSSIDTSGKATTQNTDPHAFNEYYYSTDNPVITVNAGETKRVTFSMWLEGTDKNCIVDNIPSASINVNLILSTTENRSKTVKFVDYSPNRWIKNKTSSGKEVYMYAIDKSTIDDKNYIFADRYYMKRQSDGITYIVNLPEEVKDVMFARFDSDFSDVNYNIWAENETMSTSDLDTKTYYAIGRGKDVDKVNYGYWVKSSCEDVIDVELTEAPLKNEIKFTKPDDWSTVKAYFFNDNNSTVGTKWPGSDNIRTENNHLGQTVYIFAIPEGATNVVFNNDDNGKQTVDIKITKEIGYYLSGGTDSNGKYKVSGWGADREADTNGQIFRYADSKDNFNPSIYFQSAMYGKALKLGGSFDPTAAFNKDNNYGFNMEASSKNSSGQYVYHMILPADSVIKFNGHGRESENITLSKISHKTNKIGFRFYSSDMYETY